jgi:hypothetical protein
VVKEFGEIPNFSEKRLKKQGPKTALNAFLFQKRVTIAKDGTEANKVRLRENGSVSFFGKS